MNIVRHLLFGSVADYDRPVTEAERLAQGVLSDYTHYEFHADAQIEAIGEGLALLEEWDPAFDLRISPQQDERLRFKDGSVLWLQYEDDEAVRWRFGIHDGWGAQYTECLFGASPIGMYDLHHQPDYALVRSPEDRYMYKRARNRMNQIERRLAAGDAGDKLGEGERRLCRVMFDYLAATERLDEAWNPTLQGLLAHEDVT